MHEERLFKSRSSDSDDFFKDVNSREDDLFDDVLRDYGSNDNPTDDSSKGEAAVAANTTDERVFIFNLKKDECVEVRQYQRY